MNGSTKEKLRVLLFLSHFPSFQNQLLIQCILCCRNSSMQSLFCNKYLFSHPVVSTSRVPDHTICIGKLLLQMEKQNLFLKSQFKSQQFFEIFLAYQADLLILTTSLIYLSVDYMHCIIITLTISITVVDINEFYEVGKFDLLWCL